MTARAGATRLLAALMLAAPMACAAPGARPAAAIVSEALRDPGIAAALFAQADADLADATSEHGGVLLLHELPGPGEPSFEAVAFAPHLAGDDTRFVPPPAMLTLLGASEGAGLYYHFHAQRYDNAQHAGPGPGDLRLADRLGRPALVLTFLDRGTLGAVLYHPGGRTADLGTITRPTPAAPMP